MRYQGILFDLDGVICHTDEYHFQAWKQIAQKLKIPFDEAMNHRLRGVSRKESFEIVLECYDGTLTDEQKQLYLQEKNRRYRALLQQMSPADLDPEVKRTLSSLRAMGLKLAIASSSKNAAFILERIGLSGFFDEVADGTRITRSKPEPEVFQLAAEGLGLPPERLLVVEDAKAGVLAAHAASMDCAAIGEAAKLGIAEYALSRFGDIVNTCLYKTVGE